MTIVLAVAGLVVVLIALLLVLANNGSSSSTHTVKADLVVGALSGTGNGTNLTFAGVEGGSPPGGAVTIDVGLQPVANGSAQELSRAGWLCFPITQERLIHCAPPGYLQRGAADVPLVVYDTNGQIFKGPEDLIRNDAYHGEKCPFEGGGPYHKTPRGYVACHQFPFATAFRSGPVTFSAHIVDRFDDGSLTSVVNGTTKLGPNGSASYTGTGVFTGGTRNYKGAKGRYRLSATVGLQGDGKFNLAGSVKY